MLLVPALAGFAAAANPPGDLLAITKFEISDGGGINDAYDNCSDTKGLGAKDGFFFYGDWMYIDLQIKNVSGKRLCADISAELVDAATHIGGETDQKIPEPEKFIIWKMGEQEYFETGEERGFPENNGIHHPCLRVSNPAAASAGGNEIKIKEGTYRLRVFVDNIRSSIGGCTGSALLAREDPQTWNNEATTYFTVLDAHNPLDTPEIPLPFVLFILAAVLAITRGKGKMKG